MSLPRRPLTLLAFFAVLAAVSALVTIASVRLLLSPDDWSRHDAPHGHAWLHEELDLTAEEAAAVDAFEEPYRTERARLQAEFEDRVEALARLLQDSEELTPEVTHAVHDLHLVHGQLQELSIAHYFEMLSVLPPPKQARLRQLAADALSMPQ